MSFSKHSTKQLRLSVGHNSNSAVVVFVTGTNPNQTPKLSSEGVADANKHSIDKRCHFQMAEYKAGDFSEGSSQSDQKKLPATETHLFFCAFFSVGPADLEFSGGATPSEMCNKH